MACKSVVNYFTAHALKLSAVAQVCTLPVILNQNTSGSFGIAAN